MKANQTLAAMQQGKRVYTPTPDTSRLPAPTAWNPEYPDDVNEPGDAFTPAQLDQMESDARYMEEYSIEADDAVTIICQLKDANSELRECQRRLQLYESKLPN